MRSGKRNGGEHLEKILYYDGSRLAHSAAALSSATQEGKEAPDRPDRKGSKTGFHISGVSEIFPGDGKHKSAVLCGGRFAI